MNANDIRKKIEGLSERCFGNDMKKQVLALIPKDMEIVGKEWAKEANKIGKMLQKDHMLVPKEDYIIKKEHWNEFKKLQTIAKKFNKLIKTHIFVPKKDLLTDYELANLIKAKMLIKDKFLADCIGDIEKKLKVLTAKDNGS